MVLLTEPSLKLCHVGRSALNPSLTRLLFSTRGRNHFFDLEIIRSFRTFD